MKLLKLDWKKDKWVLFSGFLGAVIILVMLISIITNGIPGWRLYWLFPGAGCVGVAYLAASKTIKGGK